MSVLRAYKLKSITSVKKFDFFNQYCSTRETKLETATTQTGTTADIPVPPPPSTTGEIKELRTENDVFIKKDALTVSTEISKISPYTTSFDEVPGPKLLQHIAKATNFIPIFGNQVTTSAIQYMLSANNLLGSTLSWGKNAYIFRWMMNEYGPVVRLQGPFGGNVVVLSRAEDALSVFTSEGRYPIRSSLDCLEKYRIEYRKFKNAGPFLMYGEDWEKLRKQIIEVLNQSTPYQFKNIDLASDQFIARLNKIKNKQDEVPATFLDELYKWSLECLCSVMLGQKIGFFAGKEDVSTSESARLLSAFRGATDAVRRCESGFHVWRYMETPAWKSLIRNCDTIDGIFGKYLREAEENLRRKQELMSDVSTSDIPLIQAMLLQEEMLPEDILTVFLDMMLVGVNAVAHSTAFLFYHLARSPRAQRILADEIKSVPSDITIRDLNNMKYLKACIKESLRLKPPIPFLSRILTKDTVVSNYHIPKGTVILMATYLSSIQEEHFDDALKFIPERWLHNDTTVASAMACIPFGYGPKSCLARNLAEMQLSLILIKVLRLFKIQYHYGDIGSTNRMLAYPDKPLKFRFESRPFI